MKNYALFSKFLMLLTALSFSAVSFSQTDTADSQAYPAANPYGMGMGMGMGMGGGIGIPPSGYMPTVIGGAPEISSGIKNEAELSPEQLEELEKNLCAEPDKPSPKTEADAECLECLNKATSPALVAGKRHAQKLFEKIADQKRIDREMAFYQAIFGENPLHYASQKIKSSLEVYKKSAHPLMAVIHPEKSLPIYKSVLKQLQTSASESKISDEERKTLSENLDKVLEEFELRRQESLKGLEKEELKDFKLFLQANANICKEQIEGINDLKNYLASGLSWPPPESVFVGKPGFWVGLVNGEEAAEVQAKFWKSNVESMQQQLAAAEKFEAENAPSGVLTKEDRLAAYEKLARHQLSLLTASSWGICGLSAAEVYAVRDYSGSGYVALNNALRGNTPDKEKYSAYRDVLNQALRKMKSYKGQVIRGSNLPPEVREQHQVGSVISYPGFTSTSLKAGFSGQDIFVIQSKSGHYIAPLAMAKDEQEVLFAADTQFKVISVTQDAGGRNRFVMEEVIPEKSP